MEEITALDKYEQQVDLMNECRSFYYSRLQKTEHYKKIFGIEPTTESTGTAKKEKPLVSSMQRLQREIVSLLDQDLILMRQLLTLNENIEEMKSRTFHGYSKESFGSSTSMFYLQGRYLSESDSHDPLSTVASQSEMEHMCQESETVFEDIQNLVDGHQSDDFKDNTVTLKHIVSTDSGFDECK
ncbi:uncharacterized protein LOC134710285 [Mytilus trossulus]|uniref:uncharacterized protein LOC134710285 n=1 Tax=Mytilus trossulus TaxID=6551 RepID=UPI0030053CCF